MASIRDSGIRPTSDRVRESLFAILREALPGARFLDLCAGTGSVGLEAHSRGAQMVIFVEPYAMRTLRENLNRCRLTEGFRVLAMKAHQAVAQLAEEGETFDIIFVDPPYDSPVLEQSLNLCEQFSLLADDGCLVAEHRRNQKLPQRVGNLSCVRRQVYGDTVLSFYIKDD